MILHHHHHHQWMLVIVARSVPFFSPLRLLLHTQLVKNVIVFRFDQSDEQPIADDDDRLDVHRCTLDRQISTNARK